ncbi:uncharacterized protein PHACADRAFT_262848 [Phanerochaete carnosa HHB-10118-sp]|uniref:Carrier domain-containing protein n=1 Tax=Phanerochaete carnosa (strain HHB-10118-sp) TaxID=650164 RepID=K5VI57_PHACS|nr:uncharacterized protein PHACADRAFT_262848 [Phanerochaete carnosa HHB-10118-sp]EKM50943.1 hypothetical protein PHACADRAFT_262848 [Phanerochaete carnosa HHB-10118-sp]
MAQATEIVAHVLRPERRGPEDEIIAFIINTDSILYVSVVLGAMRAGLVPYPMSPRNSPAAVCAMMKATGCRRIIYHSYTTDLVTQVTAMMAAQGVDLQLDDLPSYSTVFPTQPAHSNLYPTRQVGPDHIAMYLHSSGSTGTPKSIPFTEKRIWQWHGSYADNHINFIPASRLRGIRYGGMGLPTFHTFGFFVHVFYPAVSSYPIAVYAPQDPRPPIVSDAQSVFEVAKLTGCTGLYSIPSFIEAWARSQEIIDYLKTLKILVYGGGPLSQSTGLKLVQAGVKLLCGYGGTEFGSPVKVWDESPSAHPTSEVDPALRQYIQFSKTTTLRWEPQDDGTYEFVILENSGYELAIHNVPGEKAYATSDLFEPHPTREGLWRLVGRRDDVLVLSTGEKIVPIPQESHISSSGIVKGCIMFGRERELPGIIVEPSTPFDLEDEAALMNFKNSLWPRVEEANADAPTFARIFQEMVIITDPKKPLPRAAKGTVIRNQAISVYDEEIQRLYGAIATGTGMRDITRPMTWKEEDLMPWLLEQATFINGGKITDIETSLLEQGFDSLSATLLRNRIVASMRTSDDPLATQASSSISQSVLFQHPTIRELASFLASSVFSSLPHSRGHIASSASVDEVRDLISLHCSEMPQSVPAVPVLEGEGAVVLLTGATGNIGSHILASLLHDSRTLRVYVLLRSSNNGLERLRSTLSERGLPVTPQDEARLTVLVGDTTKENWGLDHSTYEQILSSVTHIVHNAWTVDFNLPLRSFHSHIAGVRALVDMCARSRRTIKIIFTSSISVASKWEGSKGAVPESVIDDPEIAIVSGYSASKYVAEQVLCAAVANGVQATTVRMGQACGSTATGSWDTTEWFPIMVKSSVALESLPDMPGNVDWVPLDVIGQVYTDWVFSKDPLPPLVNFVHPKRTPWTVILQGLEEGLAGHIPLVPLSKWVEQVEALSTSATAQDMDRIPAIKLVTFFRDMASQRDDGSGEGMLYATSLLGSSSSTIRALAPLTQAHAAMWMKHWKSNGFIPS